LRPGGIITAHPWTFVMHVFGFAGFSGSGKTTLIEQLIPMFTARGLRVSLIKHAHHAFDIDQPGKDSYRHRHAGAQEVLVTSSRRWALMHELRGGPEPSLEAHMQRMSDCDLLLVEGFKRAALPKLEVFREAVGEAPLHPHDPHIVAVATDGPITAPIPVLDLNQPAQICEFILRHLGLHLHSAPAGGSLEAGRR
jgi:molybdopterin-guanine dinucleotide biosynthesis protein B